MSESIYDVLGYEPHELIGSSPYHIFHPDEIPVLLDIHRYVFEACAADGRRALVSEETACVTYMQLKHKSGEWLPCAVEQYVNRWSS